VGTQLIFVFIHDCYVHTCPPVLATRLHIVSCRLNHGRMDAEVVAPHIDFFAGESNGDNSEEKQKKNTIDMKKK